MRAFIMICCIFLATGIHSHLGKNDTSAVKIERVWSGTDQDFLTGDISPDGRYFSDINWDTGDLRLIDLETGEIRDVTGKGYEAGRYAWVSAFSHDGQKIALTWATNNGGELRIMNLDGSDSRVIVEPNDNLRSIEPLDWSPSGEYIAVALKYWEGLRDPKWDLGWVSVEDGSVEVLRQLGWTAPGGDYPEAHMSPDGKYLGYDYRPDLEEHAREIYAYSLDERTQFTLVSGPHTNRLLGWIPNQNAILFYSDRNGSPGVWRLPVENGHPVGEPLLVQEDLPGLIPLGFSREAYLYGVTAETGWRIYRAILEPGYESLTQLPKPVDDPPFDSNFGCDWSPEGKYLAYFINGPFPGLKESLMIRAEDGQIVRKVPLSPVIHTGHAFSKWVNTGIVRRASERGKPGIFLFSPNDGTHQMLFANQPDFQVNTAWFEASPDGRTLYFVSSMSEEGEGRDLIKWDVVNGTHNVIGNVRIRAARTMTLSPNGTELAFVGQGEEDTYEIKTINTSGNEIAQLVYQSPNNQRIRIPISWAPDGKRILFCMTTPDGRESLWSKRVRGQEKPVRVQGADACCGRAPLRIHPNGHNLAFLGGHYKGEIWKMTGF
jgi:Tol biopolymer transport system component